MFPRVCTIRRIGKAQGDHTGPSMFTGCLSTSSSSNQGSSGIESKAAQLLSVSLGEHVLSKKS
jgi:hypothetical protein